MSLWLLEMLTPVNLFHKRNLLGVLRREAVIFKTVASGCSLFFGGQMCMDLAAPSAFPRKSHANSCDQINFSVEIITWPHCYVFLMLLLLLAGQQKPAVRKGLCLPQSSWSHHSKPGPGAMHCFSSGNWTSALQTPWMLPSQAPPSKAGFLRL